MATDYDIEKVRAEYIGKETSTVRGRYAVDHDPIRRYCHMVDERNPLFLDPDYGRNSRYGATICPPAGWLAMYFAGFGPWPPTIEPMLPIVPTPGRRFVNLIVETENFKPIKIGDRLSSRKRVADVYQKAISLDPEAVWITGETIISNQNDEVVCIVRNTYVVHRTPQEVAAAQTRADDA
jgi:acyl dehydratase